MCQGKNIVSKNNLISLENTLRRMEITNNLNLIADFSDNCKKKVVFIIHFCQYTNTQLANADVYGANFYCKSKH